MRWRFETAFRLALEARDANCIPDSARRAAFRFTCLGGVQDRSISELTGKRRRFGRQKTTPWEKAASVQKTSVRNPAVGVG